MSSRLSTLDAHRHFYRQAIVASHQDNQVGPGSTVYLRPAGRANYSSTRGTMMIRHGSIVGIGLCVDCVGILSTADVHLYVEKNGTTVYSVALHLTGTGKAVAVDTQAAGIDTFDAGDMIALSYDPSTSDVVTTLPLGIVELEFGDGEMTDMTEDEQEGGDLDSGF